MQLLHIFFSFQNHKVSLYQFKNKSLLTIHSVFWNRGFSNWGPGGLQNVLRGPENIFEKQSQQKLSRSLNTCGNAFKKGVSYLGVLGMKAPYNDKVFLDLQFDVCTVQFASNLILL